MPRGRNKSGSNKTLKKKIPAKSNRTLRDKQIRSRALKRIFGF